MMGPGQSERAAVEPEMTAAGLKSDEGRYFLLIPF
jgi:hypothetical protein